MSNTLLRLLSADKPNKNEIIKLITFGEIKKFLGVSTGGHKPVGLFKVINDSRATVLHLFAQKCILADILPTLLDKAEVILTREGIAINKIAGQSLANSAKAAVVDFLVTPDNNGWSALHYAVYYGDFGSLECVISEGHNLSPSVMGYLVNNNKLVSQLADKYFISGQYQGLFNAIEEELQEVRINREAAEQQREKETAATKIQALFRGHKAREELKKQGELLAEELKEALEVAIRQEDASKALGQAPDLQTVRVSETTNAEQETVAETELQPLSDITTRTLNPDGPHAKTGPGLVQSSDNDIVAAPIGRENATEAPELSKGKEPVLATGATEVASTTAPTIPEPPEGWHKYLVKALKNGNIEAVTRYADSDAPIIEKATNKRDLDKGGSYTVLNMGLHLLIYAEKCLIRNINSPKKQDYIDKYIKIAECLLILLDSGKVYYSENEDVSNVSLALLSKLVYSNYVFSELNKQLQGELNGYNQASIKLEASAITKFIEVYKGNEGVQIYINKLITKDFRDDLTEVSWNSFNSSSLSRCEDQNSRIQDFEEKENMSQKTFIVNTRDFTDLFGVIHDKGDATTLSGTLEDDVAGGA
ncbi:MAG: hypothetical protein Tsb006_5660 [Rickettsiaceae bacterium]